MTRDVLLRSLFIPLLGVFLPVVSGMLHYENYSTRIIIIAGLYFISTSFIIWTGCDWMHARLRSLMRPYPGLLKRIFTICFASALFGGCIGCISALGWTQIMNEPREWNNILRFVLACIVAVIVFTLIYEILFLNKEREMNKRIVNKLDRERSIAQLHVLQNEMDPHFIFNSLNTLNHLILHNPAQAHLFNNKLAQVYKYFLINKERELISLEKELEFIEDYFYLLKLRHEDKLLLDTQLNTEQGQTVMIPPCSLQLLVENAIKHNSFSQAEPLRITIAMNGQHLKVMNKMKPKPYLANSTQIGLKNLSSRYKLLCKKDIIIEAKEEMFTVKLPIIR